MNAIIDRIYTSGVVEDREGHPREAFPASLQHEDGQALYDIVRKYGPKSSLEIGMAYGLSSLFICQAHHDNGGARHTVVDPLQTQWFDGIGRLNLERAGFESMCTFVEEPSYLALADLIRAGERFDFVFIDGNHRFDYTLVDFFLVDKVLDDGGLVVLHDSWLPAIRKVLAFIVRNRADSFELVPEFTFPAPFVLKWRRFVALLKDNPLDVGAAHVFSARQFYNYCVLRKTASHDEVAFAEQWQSYTSF